MPPRWPRKPDRNDPAYRRLDDRMNFATHVAVFAASNSGLWFFRLISQSPDTPPFTWAPLFTLGWLFLLVGHGIYVFAIANYSMTSLMKPVDPIADSTSTQSTD